MNPKDLTFDEIQALKEGICKGCKGVLWMEDTGCYETCEMVRDELKEWEENEVVT